MVGFSFREDTLLAAPRLRPVIGFVFLWQATKNMKTYTTLRFSFRTDTLLAGARMRMYAS